MSNTFLERDAKATFGLTNLAEPVTFIEYSEASQGVAIGQAGGTATVEIDPAGTVYVTGDVVASGTNLVSALASKAAVVTAPAHYNSTGTAGSIAVDGTNVYVCLDTDSWLQISNAGVFSTTF